MSLEHHKDGKQRYEQQVENAKNYVLPFIEQTTPIGSNTRVFEMGCGEGGVMQPFAERGCFCLGVDLDLSRIEEGKLLLEKEVATGKVKLLYKNVFDADFFSEYKNSFDVIILKDVIEHLHDQEKFIPYLQKFLREGGQIFFGFPPWYMPFGGHQQLAHNKIAMMPYYHILPRPIYKSLLQLFGENKEMVDGLIEIYDTRITIERFERIIKNTGLKVKNKQFYLINPIYKYKFGLQPRKQWGPITHLPFIRNFLTTCVYYSVG